MHRQLHRSIHNTRIERLWFDVTRAFGAKWKNFFIGLELHDGLNPDNPSHIWLLHHLFLSAVDLDAREFAASWNGHKLEYKDEDGVTTTASPADRYFFGMVEHGTRGFQGVIPDESLPNDDIADYGVDFDVYGDVNVLAHHMDNNAEDWANGFDTVPPPERTTEIAFEPATCPFTPQQVQILDTQLSLHLDINSRVMTTRRLMWIHALSIARTLN